MKNDEHRFITAIFIILSLTTCLFGQTSIEGKLDCGGIEQTLITAEKPSLFYRGLEYLFAANIAGDTFTTWINLDTGKCYELNPIAKLYIGNKPLAIIINSGVAYAVLAISRVIHKKNKTLATAILIATNVIEGYMIISNINVNRRLNEPRGVPNISICTGKKHLPILECF